jgi:hypothetical protein
MYNKQANPQYLPAGGNNLHAGTKRKLAEEINRSD